MQLDPLQIVLLTIGSTLFGVLCSAFITGLYSLRTKRNEYVNDYYKKIIDRRIGAYEQLENLIANLKTAVLDQDAKPYHLLLSDDWAEAYGHIGAVMAQTLWLSDEAFRKTQELNYLIFRIKPTPDQVVEFAKQNYQKLAELREDLQKILVADMLDLPDVKGFLKSKKKSKSDGNLLNLRIDDTQGLVPD